MAIAVNEKLDAMVMAKNVYFLSDVPVRPACNLQRAKVNGPALIGVEPNSWKARP